MTRSGRFLAAIATVLALVVVVGTLGSAGGCSDPGTLPRTGRDDTGDKVAQDKMRDYMQQKPTKGKAQKGIR
jgi:hypothetical protein